MEAAYAEVESVDGMVPRVGAAFSEARDVVQVVAFSVTLQSWDASVDHCIYHWFPVVFLQLLVPTGQCVDVFGVLGVRVCLFGCPQRVMGQALVTDTRVHQTSHLARISPWAKHSPLPFDFSLSTSSARPNAMCSARPSYSFSNPQPLLLLLLFAALDHGYPRMQAALSSRNEPPSA